MATYSEALCAEYEDSRAISWKNSPFGWIKAAPSRTRGAIGEKLVTDYLTRKKFDVAPCGDSDADITVADNRVEIKMSTLWADGSYRFQQFRDQRYDFAVCLGIGPFDVHCWALPKETILERWAAGDIRSQHGGAAGVDTAWLRAPVRKIPVWLNEWGGSLSDAVRAIAEITGQEPPP